ncbi:MAG TPA: hypothetical protein VIY48_08500, partial [Candidatus Paceibacterota bacterium]
PAGAEPEVTPQAESPARPDYLDPRFKTVEDQAKAYREAEIKMQHEAQRRSLLERELQMRQQQPQPTAAPIPEPQEDLNSRFWQEPTAVIEKILEKRLGDVTKRIEPFIEDRIQMQKSKYANDETFKQLEPQIDQVFRLQPQLKEQPGALDYVYSFLRAQTFDPAAERQRIEQEVRAQIAGGNRQVGQVEGAGNPSQAPSQTPKVELSADEQIAARKFYSDLPPQEAYKRYYQSKINWAKGA